MAKYVMVMVSVSVTNVNVMLSLMATILKRIIVKVISFLNTKKPNQN